MPLIDCPDCGKPVSDQAPTCPQCGRVIKKQQAGAQEGCFLQTLNFGCGVIVLLIAIMFIIAMLK